MSAPGNTVSSGPWSTGCDSFSDATLVSESSFRWSVNAVSRGGLPRTRPGLNCFPVSTLGQPRGIEVFTDQRGITHIVIAIGSQILFSSYPFTSGFNAIPGLLFATTSPIIFKKAIQNVTEATDGTLTLINPLPVLMISDGETRTAYWDGLNARHLDPTKAPNGPSETPVFEWMEFTGNRLWGSDGSRLRASNLANPLKFTEEDILSEGGALGFPGMITGLGQTADFKNLLVFTDQTTSSVQSNILDRTQWQLTPGFQTVIFPDIGCAAGKSITTQNGITFWYSHGGIIGLDQAILTYRTGRIHFQDQAMNWSKSNLSPNISGICVGTFENYLMMSVPSGDIWNAHTWIMDQAWAREEAVSDVYASIKGPTWNSVWTGIRPVEWVTAVVNGISRCFVLSYDYPPTGSNTPQNNVWEAFAKERIDVGLNNSAQLIQKPIQSSLETRVLGTDANYKDFRYIEIDCEDISGVVDISISFAPLRGGYKEVSTKQIVASQWTVVNGQTTIAVDTFLFNSYRSQSRILRTASDQQETSDASYTGVESNYPRQTDHGFSVLIQWTGKMSVRAVRLTTDSALQEAEGHCEVSELTDRHVQNSGLQAIESTTPPNLVDGLDMTSAFVGSNTRTWIENLYSSMS
jgi:hypothetical protein